MFPGRSLYEEKNVRRPLAATHLARVIQMTSTASLSRAVAEERVKIRSTGPDDDLILKALKTLAQGEKVIEDEARALAAARSWPATLAGSSYGWSHLSGDTARDTLPRILRILDREVFELEQDARADHEDEEVRSLTFATLDGRRSVFHALAALSPASTLPGGK